MRTIHDVAYVNDSKATNADATARALAVFRQYWIIGGQPKEGGLNGLDPYMDRITHAYLIGEAAPQFCRMVGRTEILGVYPVWNVGCGGGCST